MKFPCVFARSEEGALLNGRGGPDQLFAHIAGWDSDLAEQLHEKKVRVQAERRFDSRRSRVCTCNSRLGRLPHRSEFDTQSECDPPIPATAERSRLRILIFLKSGDCGCRGRSRDGQVRISEIRMIECIVR
jgi:hypothetical protein